MNTEQLQAVSDLPSVQTILVNESFNADLPRPESTVPRTTTNTDIVPPGVDLVWGSYAASSANPNSTAWVMDTGCDLDHTDLNVDIARAISFVPTEPTAEDYNGHGTHVAGTIGAKYNNSGVVGVAPGATIVPVKVLAGDGSGQTGWLVNGLNYIASHAMINDVVNISIQTTLPDPTYELDNLVRAIADRGIMVVICAGNYKQNTANQPLARIVHNNVKIVGATQNNSHSFAVSFPGSTSQGSNYGTNIVAAPGVSILSTYLNNSTATLSGTSMAAPHVAGLYLYTRNCNCPCDPSTIITPRVNNVLQFSTPAVPGCALNPGNMYASGYPYASQGPFVEVKRIYVYRPTMEL